MSDTPVPSFHQMMNPLLLAIKDLGGSANISELDEKVIELMNLPQDVIDVPQNKQKPGRSKVAYRLAWTRNYLKHYGLLENSSRAVWTLTPLGWKSDKLEERKIVKEVKRMQAATAAEELGDEEAEEEPTVDDIDWQEQLLQVISEIEPAAFERLAQRLLRESGFVQVEVTGRSGDGGIDGKGILRISGLMSFHVYFQTKRQKQSIGVGVVRDFRGALEGRADRGLLITSSTFTRDAKAEANRDGATPIELIDGSDLATMLKEKGLGVQVEKVEQEVIHVNGEWFSNL